MAQQELSLAVEMQKIDTEVVAKQPSFTAALILCQTLGGIEDKELCGKGGIINADATWSRIKSGANNFPQDNLLKYMTICENEAPLIWLADRSGYVLTKKETVWEKQARIEKEARLEAETEVRYLRSLITGRATA